MIAGIHCCMLENCPQKSIIKETPHLSPPPQKTENSDLYQNGFPLPRAWAGGIRQMTEIRRDRPERLQLMLLLSIGLAPSIKTDLGRLTIRCHSDIHRLYQILMSYGKTGAIGIHLFTRNTGAGQIPADQRSSRDQSIPEAQAA